jgi:hypothetical protein
MVFFIIISLTLKVIMVLTEICKLLHVTIMGKWGYEQPHVIALILLRCLRTLGFMVYDAYKTFLFH